jgi:hypothetical protein
MCKCVGWRENELCSTFNLLSLFSCSKILETGSFTGVSYYYSIEFYHVEVVMDVLKTEKELLLLLPFRI